MTNSELIAHLQALPGDLEVYTAVDDEGNGYNNVYFVPSVRYVREDGFDISMVAEEDITDDPNDEDLDWDKTFRGDVTPVIIVG